MFRGLVQATRNRKPETRNDRYKLLPPGSTHAVVSFQNSVCSFLCRISTTGRQLFRRFRFRPRMQFLRFLVRDGFLCVPGPALLPCWSASSPMSETRSARGRSLLRMQLERGSRMLSMLRFQRLRLFRGRRHVGDLLVAHHQRALAIDSEIFEVNSRIARNASSLPGIT